MTTITLPTTAKTLEVLYLPGDVRHELLHPDPDDGSTEVEVWTALDGHGQSITLTRWSSGRGSFTGGADSEWGDWTDDGRLLLDNWDGAWVDEDGEQHDAGDDREDEAAEDALT